MKKSPRPQRLTKSQLDKLVEEAVVDAYDEDEQVMGFYTMIDDNLPWPFETEVLGVPVIVEKLELRGRNQIVAVCKRGAKSQAIPIVDLPLPSPPPKGAEWIEAYQHWLKTG